VLHADCLHSCPVADCTDTASPTFVPHVHPAAGVELRAFVARWVSMMEAGDGVSAGLLEHARADPNVNERYSYGAHYVFANIGPPATEPTTSREELLLFAVIAVYQHAGYPGGDPARWEGERAHVERAFAFAQQLGEREIARRLRAEVFARSAREPSPVFEEMLQNSLGNDPARSAAHDQRMASIDARSFRAADLLDPHGDIDAELAALRS
jgi:hypothetical protein